MPHGITQCYLPPDRGDIPALTLAEAGTLISDPGSAPVGPTNLALLTGTILCNDGPSTRRITIRYILAGARSGAVFCRL